MSNQFRTQKYNAEDINEEVYKTARKIAAQSGEYVNPDGTTNGENITEYISEEYFNIESFKRRKDIEQKNMRKNNLERERVYQYTGDIDCIVSMLSNKVTGGFVVLEVINGKVVTCEKYDFNRKKQAQAKMLQIQKRICTEY